MSFSCKKRNLKTPFDTTTPSVTQQSYIHSVYCTYLHTYIHTYKHSYIKILCIQNLHSIHHNIHAYIHTYMLFILTTCQFFSLLKVKRLQESLLDITAIVLANLCVGYIMTSQNEEAEELMRRIEKEGAIHTYTFIYILTHIYIHMYVRACRERYFIF